MQTNETKYIQQMDRTYAYNWPDQYYIKSLESLDYYAFTAHMDNLYIGSIFYRIIKDAMFVDKILISKNYRQWGIGSKLLQTAMLTAQSCGAKDVTLKVAVDNIDAIVFYSNHGFKIEQIHSDYYAVGEDAFQMQRNI